MLVTPALLAFGTECLKTFQMVYGDMPPEMRRDNWLRWHKLFEPLFRALGLDVEKDMPK